MGIIIYELNLFVSTLSHGISGNVPVILMYGTEAVSFLSFFSALGAVMIPVVIPDYIKGALDGSSYSDAAVQLLIALGLFLYLIGFFGGSSIRKQIKFKLTGRIALVVTTAVGFMLSLAAGIVDIPVVTMILVPFIGFSYGMAFDSLRDYRINAGKLGFEEFTDRKIHNIQYAGYFLGVSVGAVIAGICFERFGLLIVNLIGGSVMFLSCLGIIYFIRDNNPPRELYLPVNKWLEMISDKYAGRFLMSAYFSMGILVSFLLCFVPNFLDTVGISLATSSFYYLLAAFFALFVGMIIKERFQYALTSRTRVIISSFSSLLGFILFALMPTAKMLCVTVALVGGGLGVHDFYYLYVLFLISNSRFKARYNLRKAAEMTFVTGMAAAVPVFALSVIFDMRIVFIIAIVFYFICSFIYPFSTFSSQLDEKIPSSESNRGNRRNYRRSSVDASNLYMTNASRSAEDIVMETPETADFSAEEGTSGFDVSSFINEIDIYGEGGSADGFME